MPSLWLWACGWWSLCYWVENCRHVLCASYLAAATVGSVLVPVGNCSSPDPSHAAAVTCSTSRSRTPVARAPHQNRDACLIKSAMPLPHNVQKLQQEGRLALSKRAFQNNQF